MMSIPYFQKIMYFTITSQAVQIFYKDLFLVVNHKMLKSKQLSHKSVL